MPDIFAYIDYRRYLRDFYAEQKERHPYFSYQYMGRRVGVDASNLAKVLIGQRHLPKNSVRRFKEFCRFTDNEYEYFSTMVLFGKARTDKASQEHFEKLVRLQYPRPKILEPFQYEFCQHWYHTAILTLLDYYDFRGNYRALAAHLLPAITPAQARESIDLLLRLKLIGKEAGGRYVLTNNIISTGEKWRSMAVHKFQRDTMELALRALEQQDKRLRDISTLTVTASRKDLESIRDLTREYRHSVLKLVEQSTDAETVYQVNIQIFPLTRDTDGGTP